MQRVLFSTLLATLLIAASAAYADIKVGFITSLSGNASSIGIPYARGIAAALAYLGEIKGQKIQLLQLDDGSDPSAATRNARKLGEDDNVDVIIGAATTPSTLAVAGVAAELKVPFIAISPLTLQFSGKEDQWAVSVPQPPSF